jgi:hypothetical protein
MFSRNSLLDTTLGLRSLKQAFLSIREIGEASSTQADKNGQGIHNLSMPKDFANRSLAGGKGGTKPSITNKFLVLACMPCVGPHVCTYMRM